MAETPYELLAKAYQKQLDSIQANQAIEENNRVQREQAAKKQQSDTNRGIYTTYKQAINPYGSQASQANLSQGTSEYLKNAAYGTMLQGIGQSQANYQDAMNQSNTLWLEWLANKAQQEANAEQSYADAVIAQQNADKALAASSSSGGGGGGSYISDSGIGITDSAVIDENGYVYKNGMIVGNASNYGDSGYAGAQGNTLGKSNKAVRYVTKKIGNNYYKIGYNADGLQVSQQKISSYGAGLGINR